jgi:flagellar biosynthesis/type III secretory pathway M-ring protein FliF/YscJ
MDAFNLLTLLAVVLLVLALCLQPLMQRRREDAMFRLMQEARDAAEAKALAESAVAKQKQQSEDERNRSRSKP